MNEILENVNEAFQRRIIKEMGSELEILEFEVFEWLQELTVQTKTMEFYLAEANTEEAFFARKNELSEYLMER